MTDEATTARRATRAGQTAPEERRRRLNRQESRDRTRELLLDAAMQVFARRGFQGASVDEIAATAGFTKGAVYANFASKDDLMLALLDRRVDAEFARVGAMIREAPSLDAVVATVGREFGESADQLRDLALLSTEFWLYSMREPHAREALAERYRTMQRLLADLVSAKAAEEGRRIAIQPLEVHAVIEGLSTGLMMMTLLAPDLVPPDLYGRVLRALLSPSAGAATAETAPERAAGTAAVSAPRPRRTRRQTGPRRGSSSL
jgi:AcrR family transcriptional regulator